MGLIQLGMWRVTDRLAVRVGAGVAIQAVTQGSGSVDAFHRLAPRPDSGRPAAAVAADVQEGTRLGITGTPTFFINGRLVVGALPLEAFQRIIERELRRSSK